MGVKTREEFFESIRKQRPNVYIRGEKVTTIADHPLCWTGINSVAVTYDVSNDPACKSWATTVSPLTNETISRWTHLPRSVDDCVKKVEIMREAIHRTWCVIRCAVTDTGTAMWAATWEIDQKYGTQYHKRFAEYWKHIEKNDLNLATGVTDVKGDRMKRPSEQLDPDMYVHIVERKKDGIVVRGAKSNITGAPYAHEILVAPTRDLRKGEEDYAVAFAVPIDTKGITMITRPGGEKREKDSIERPISRNCGQTESLVVFEDVFVPWERVFMAGEVDYAAALVLNFACMHRFTKCACKSAQCDLYVGAAALAAEVNGVNRAGHVQEKIADLVITAGIANACAYASAYKAKAHPSGIYFVDPLMANVGKYYASHDQGNEWIILQDIAGGIVVTAPTARDWENPVERKYIEKYYKAAPHIDTETRLRAIKLVEDFTVGSFAGWSMGIGLNGGGSPIAEKIEAMRRYDVRGMMKWARFHANIPEPPEKPKTK
jgi:aromatic ring hydroxylase